MTRKTLSLLFGAAIIAAALSVATAGCKNDGKNQVGSDLNKMHERDERYKSIIGQLNKSTIPHAEGQ
jgi:hypothetical protein